jgi:adenylate kinase family enzyme
MTLAVGSRVQVVGNTGSGKSTLAEEIARALGAPLVELDALNWLPGWVGLNDTDPPRLAARIAEATAGPTWVVAGNYRTFTVEALWPRLDTLIWLDLPLRVVLPRVVARLRMEWVAGSGHAPTRAPR